MLHLLVLLAGFLQTLATTGADAQTTITSDPSVASNHHFDYVCTHRNLSNDISKNAYKFWLQIVAGGGLSGLVVANKLSGKGYSVLVVEYVCFVSSLLMLTDYGPEPDLMLETR